jgi:hypothetical protein
LNNDCDDDEVDSLSSLVGKRPALLVVVSEGELKIRVKREEVKDCAETDTEDSLCVVKYSLSG